jgi:hypothetical protein
VNPGDRVKIRNRRSCWFGASGTVRGQRGDGRLWVQFSWLPFWQMFWPHELEPLRRAGDER